MSTAQPFAHIARKYDVLNDVISGGLHRRWKRRLVASVHEHALFPLRTVLDVSTGTGQVAEFFFQHRSESTPQVFGVDPCREMLVEGVRRCQYEHLRVQSVSEMLPLQSASINALTCAFGVRNFSQLNQALQEWHRILTPGGVAAILEIHPIPEVWYDKAMHFYWRKILPRLGQVVGKKEAYEYLRDSALAFLDQNALVEKLQAAGFVHLASRSLFSRGMVGLTLVRRP